MALQKLEPDRERVEAIAYRMKEIIETTWSRDPSLNERERIEYNGLVEELTGMGLHASYDIRVDPISFKVKAEVTVLIPKNITIH